MGKQSGTDALHWSQVRLLLISRVIVCSEATVREHNIAISVRPRVGRPHSAFFELGPFIILTDTSAPKQSHTPQDSRVSRTNL